MTIIQDRPATETGTCPPWCMSHMEDDDGGRPVHLRPVGTLGVEVVADPDEPVGLVYVPELDLDDLHASPAFARQLAADLIAAADVLGGVTE